MIEIFYYFKIIFLKKYIFKDFTLDMRLLVMFRCSKFYKQLKSSGSCFNLFPYNDNSLKFGNCARS